MTEEKLKPEQEKERAAEQARVELLKVTIEKLVDSLVQDNDFTVWELGYAQDLFKDLMIIKTHSSKQYDELLKINNAANENYYAVLGKDLIKMDTPDVKTISQPTEETKA